MTSKEALNRLYIIADTPEQAMNIQSYYDIVKKDLEVLDILRKHIEKNHITKYYCENDIKITRETIFHCLRNAEYGMIINDKIKEAQEEQMKQQKDNLYNYLQNRVIALTTYIKSYEDMIKEYPETESVNRARIIATELQLEEINKVISYCEKRGRY